MSRTPLTLAAVAAVAALAAPTVALAQPAMQPLPEGPSSAPAVKDGATATLLAVGVTAAGLGLAAASAELDGQPRELTSGLGAAGFAAMMLGPSAGHFYAGEHGHGVVTSLGRTAAVGAMVAGFGMTFDLCFEHCDDDDDDDALGDGLMIGGAATLVALTAYDLWDAHRAAGRSNTRRALKLVPTAVASARGPVTGLALTGQF